MYKNSKMKRFLIGLFSIIVFVTTVNWPTNVLTVEAADWTYESPDLMFDKYWDNNFVGFEGDSEYTYMDCINSIMENPSLSYAINEIIELVNRSDPYTVTNQHKDDKYDTSELKSALTNGEYGDGTLLWGQSALASDVDWDPECYSVLYLAALLDEPYNGNSVVHIDLSMYVAVSSAKIKCKVYFNNKLNCDKYLDKEVNDVKLDPLSSTEYGQTSGYWNNNGNEKKEGDDYFYFKNKSCDISNLWDNIYSSENTYSQSNIGSAYDALGKNIVSVSYDSNNGVPVIEIGPIDVDRDHAVLDTNSTISGTYYIKGGTADGDITGVEEGENGGEVSTNDLEDLKCIKDYWDKVILPKKTTSPDEYNGIIDAAAKNADKGIASYIIANLAIGENPTLDDDTTVTVDEGGNYIIDDSVFDNYHVLTAGLSVNLRDVESGSPKTSYIFKSSSSNKEKKVMFRQGYEIDKSDYSDITPLQWDMLAVTYSNIVKSRGLENQDGVIKNMLLKDKFPDIGTGEYEAVGSITDSPSEQSEIQDLVTEFENSNFTRSAQGIIDVARLANTLSLYSIYTSINYEQSALEDSAVYNADLSALLDNWDYMKDVENNESTDTTGNEEVPNEFVYMPADIEFMADSYGNLCKDDLQGDMGFRKICNIFYAVSYAFEALVDSEFGCESGYGYEAIDKLLSDPSSVDPDMEKYEDIMAMQNWLLSCWDTNQYNKEKAAQTEIKHTTSIWIFRSIIELHDMCDNLSIDPDTWSVTISKYYKLYDDHQELFDAMRGNTSLYGLGYTSGATVDNPIGQFFSVEEGIMSDNWINGFSLSALYTPMVTNLYDASTYSYVDDPTWISDYFYKYGFNRKALYVSTDPNIVTNSKLGKTSDNGRVIATLRDLVNYDRDIQLYVDTNFYNADQIEGAIGKVDYATLYQYVNTKQETYNITDSAAAEQLESQDKGSLNQIYSEKEKNFVDETLNLDTNTLLKTNGVLNYSIDVAKNVTKFGEAALTEKQSLYDSYVLSQEAIIGEDNVFSMYQYSPMVAYGVVSAIYRDASIYNELSAMSTSTTVVFESSRNVLFVNNSKPKDWIDYMNYLMLANLEKQMFTNVETQLDLDSPIFVDLFGNIVTESGYVIIPAASNPTLTGYDRWNPYTVAFGTYMEAGDYEEDISMFPEDVRIWLTGMQMKTVSTGNEDNIEVANDEDVEELTSEDLDDLTKKSGGWFIFDRKGRLSLKNVELKSHGLIATVNWRVLNSHSDVIQQVFWNDAYFTKGVDIYKPRVVNMVTEVLRGAPIENIDYAKEGITTVESSDAGIVIAYALDKLLTTISSNSHDFVNSIATMPNVAVMPYLKYVIYFAIKITIALLIVLFLIRLFMDGVRNHFGFKYVVSLCFTVVVVVSAIYILPNSIVWSYDKANATVLSTEAADMLLYQTLRESEGQEIGITNVQQINEITDLYMEIGKVTPKWSDILGKGLLGNDYNSFTDLFDDAMKDTPYYDMGGVVQKGTTVYIPADYIINSTQITYSKSLNTLHNKVVIDPSSDKSAGFYGVYSYVSPYYAILDQLIANINEFNNSHDISSYTVGVDSKGSVLTYDIAAPYLLSEEFQETGYDILGLNEICGCTTVLPKHTSIFDANDKEEFALSLWYPKEIDEDTKQARIREIYDYSRAFVAEHKDVLKHIPDSMFVKILAFATAVKYNQVFHVQYADAIRLITVDNRDIMRFMLGDFRDVYSNYAYTFGRYVYNTTGTIGVILAAVLAAVILITTVLKPVLIVMLFVLIIINIAFRNLIFKKPNKGVEGYFIGCALFMILNFIYAGGLKICFLMSNSNLSSIAAMAICIVIQILYLLGMLVFIWIQISDWKNVGYNHFQNVGATLFGGLHLGFNRGMRRGRRSRNNERRLADGRRPISYNDGYETVNIRATPSNEPQRVIIEENNGRRPRNRQVYRGNRTVADMMERDEEREMSVYNRR